MPHPKDPPQLDIIEPEKPSRPRRCKSSVTDRLDSTYPQFNYLREKVVDSIDIFSFKKGGDPAISSRLSDDGTFVAKR